MKFSKTTCRHKPNETGNSAILIRVCFQGKRVNLHTGFACEEKKWDKKRQQVKNGARINGFEYNNVNNAIREQETFIDAYFNDAAYRSSAPSLTELKERFNRKFKRNSEELSDEFFYLFDKFIEEQSVQKNWGDSMTDTFVRLKKLIKEYKQDITFADLTTATMNGLLTFLSVKMLNEALEKRLSYLKQFINWAKGKNYKVHEEYFTFAPKLPKSKNAIKYLKREELIKIQNLSFEPFSALDIVRDAFVFQCYTALRYSDLKTLRHDNIINTGVGYEIDILTEKDDDRVRYPLAESAAKIYEKYKDYKYKDNVVFPIMSNQKYNEHLKEVGKIAALEGEWTSYQYRLNEKIIVKIPKCNLCSHTARRTFITLALENGASQDLIAQITSHSEIKAMKPYVATTQKGLKKVIDAIDNK